MADLIREMAASASMSADEFKSVVKQRCFKDAACSDAQLILLLTIAHKYDLNPLTREVHAFINEKRGNVMEMAIALDGWIKIATRHPQFDGYQIREELNEADELTAIHMQMHRKDWKYPGVYTAWMDEWLVVSKPGKDPSNWEQYPRHRLFGKAFQECARFTFGITEAGDEDDPERIARTELPPPPAQIEPPLREGTGEKLRLGDVEMTKNPEACAHTGCMAGAAGEFETKVGKLKLCAEHGELHRIKKRGRRAKEGDANQSGSVSSPANNATAASLPAPDGAAAQPNGAPSQPAHGGPINLADFISLHKVPQTRINMMLAKHDAEKVVDLTPKQEKEILSVLERSYANV